MHDSGADYFGGTFGPVVAVAPVDAEEPLPDRPRTRGDCVDGPRPCPWVGCRHHLYLEVRSGGKITINTAGEPDEMEETCSLDVADKDEPTLDWIGKLWGISREGIRHIEREAKAKAAQPHRGLLSEFADDDDAPVRMRRRLPVLREETPMLPAPVAPPVAAPAPAPRPVARPVKESLADRAARLRKPMQDAASGPLIIAGEVMAIIESWDDYAEEAGGISAAAWVRATFGSGVNVRWFARRRDAVKVIGEHARRVWHHEAAVWAAEHLDGDALRTIDADVIRAAQAGPPLVRAAVRRLAEKNVTIAVAVKTRARCKNCEELEAKLASLEFQLSERS